MGVNDINSLAHSKWNCKYHIVFAPKYRRMVFYGQKKHEVGKILRKLCEWKGVEVLNAEACPNHIHMLLSIPPKYSVSKQLEEDKMGDQLTMSEARAFRKKKK